jgi:hypothetical protein
MAFKEQVRWKETANHAGNSDRYSGATGVAVGGRNHNIIPPLYNQKVQGLLSPDAGLHESFLGKATAEFQNGFLRPLPSGRTQCSEWVGNIPIVYA